MLTLRVWLALLLVSICSACSQDVATGRRCGNNQPGCSSGIKGTTSDGGQTGIVGNAGSDAAGSGAVGQNDNALTVHVQDIQKMTIQLVTLQCAGDCADVEAVAHGGNPPYAFAWEDGSTNAKRHVCLDASTTLAVSATDTAIEAEEFRYAAETASAKVTATVLECSDAGVATDGGEGACGAGFKPGVYEGTFMQALGPLSGTHELILMKSAADTTQETISGSLDNVLTGASVTAMVTWVDGSSFDCTMQRLFLSGVRSEPGAFPLPYTYEATYDPADDTLQGTWAAAAPPSPGVFPTNALDSGTWDAHWVRP